MKTFRTTTLFLFLSLSLNLMFGQNPKMDGYLFAYFEGKGDGDQQEQVRFAVSDDAIHWKATYRFFC